MKPQVADELNPTYFDGPTVLPGDEGVRFLAELRAARMPNPFAEIAEGPPMPQAVKPRKIPYKPVDPIPRGTVISRFEPGHYRLWLGKGLSTEPLIPYDLIFAARSL